MNTPRDSLASLDGPRPARPEELDDVLDAVNLVMRTSRGRPPTFARDYPLIYRPKHAGHIMIVRDDTQVVASTATWVNEVRLGDATLRVGGINAVVTRPEYRKRGLGSRVMGACHEHLAAQRCHVGLLGTQISNWYRKLGWERAGTTCRYQLNLSNAHLLPTLDQAGLALRDAGPISEVDEATLETMVSLEARSRLGGVRDVVRWRALHAARGGADRRVVIAHRAGEPAGYLLVRDRLVTDWAGDEAQTLAAMVRAWLDRLHEPTASTSARDEQTNQPALQDTLTIIGPALGHPFVELLRRLGVPHELGYHGMIRVLDAPGILEAFGIDQLEVQTDGGGETFTLARGGECITVDRRTLTQLLFGPERPSAFAADLLPLPFWQWSMERV